MSPIRDYAPRFRAVLVLFWAAWFSIVLVTNVFDGFKALGVLSPDWKFASGNWALLVSVTRLYNTPMALTALLFLGVIAWEAAAAVLFWRALASRGSEAFNGIATQAFVVATALSCAFLLADEIFLAYTVAGTHMHMLIAQIVSAMVVGGSQVREFSGTSN